MSACGRPHHLQGIYSQCACEVACLTFNLIDRLVGLCVTGLSFCAADTVLHNFRERFLQCVDANAIVYGLENVNIISDGDLREITRNSDAKQQNEILHRCLRRSCDEEALMEVCDMMIAVRGNRKMNSLGRDMKCELEGISLCVCGCVRVHV